MAPAVATGAASPSVPLALPADGPKLLLNGAELPAAFARLSPSAAGLYQINFVMPSRTLGGDVRLQVKQSYGTSNTVTMPVKR